MLRSTDQTVAQPQGAACVPLGRPGRVDVPVGAGPQRLHVVLVPKQQVAGQLFGNQNRSKTWLDDVGVIENLT